MFISEVPFQDIDWKKCRVGFSDPLLPVLLLQTTALSTANLDLVDVQAAPYR
jgi:hypothetical protein